jgi:outer membrane biosynthesis protein TonB
MAALPASAQQPSQAEKDAIRSNCRSDFLSKCSSVTPGGIEALQCLKKNEASLSGGCRAAVTAIKLPGETPAAAPAPAPAPAAATPAPSPQPAPAAAAPKPAETKAAVPEPAKPVAPKPTQAKPVAAPKPAVAAVPAAPAPVATPTPPAATSSQPKPVPLSEAILVRRFCTTDYQVLCKGTPLGGGRVIKCLSANQPALSPNCKEAIARAQ